MPKLMSPAELSRVLRDVRPFTEQSQAEISAILNDARTLQKGDHRDVQALGNCMLVMQAHINSLERKLEQARQHVSHGHVRGNIP